MVLTQRSGRSSGLFAHPNNTVERKYVMHDLPNGGVDFDASLTEMVHGDDENKEHEHLQGTLFGVYIPIVSSMWGVLIFIRYSIIVGYTGWGMAFGFTILCGFVQTLTTFSLCAVLSNTKSFGNGIFGIFKQNLGALPASIICLIYYLGMTCMASVELLGSVQAIDIVLYASPNGPDTILGSRWLDQVVIGGCILLCLAVIRLMKVSVIHGLTAVILVIVVFAFIFGFIGVFKTLDGVYRGTYSHELSQLTGITAETFWANRLPNFTIPSNETMFELAGTYLEEVEESSFKSPQAALGTIFPMFLGIFQGANKAGQLKTPNESIFVGTISAIATSTVVYSFFFLVLAGVAQRDLLKADALLFDYLTWPSQYIGIVATILVGLGACAELLEIGPTILYYIANDGTISILKRWKFDTMYRGQPIYCIGVSFLINFCLLFVTSSFFETLANVVTMFFLQAYLQMHYTLLLNELYHHASWRPLFKFYHWTSALLGFLTCLVLMFYIQWIMALITLTAAYALYLFVEVVEKPQRLGLGNFFYRIGRMLRFLLKEEYIIREETFRELFINERPDVEHAPWSPQIIVLLKNPSHIEHRDENIKLLQLARNLTSGNKFLPHLAIAATIVHQEHYVNLDADNVIREKELELFIMTLETRLQAFCKAVMAPIGCTDLQATQLYVQSAGLGSIRPNLVLVPVTRGDYIFEIASRPQVDNKKVFLVHHDFNCLEIVDMNCVDLLEDEDEELNIEQEEATDSLTQIETHVADFLQEQDPETGPSDSRKANVAKMFRDHRSRVKLAPLKGTLDIYWIVRNGGLAVLIGNILLKCSLYKQCKMRVIVIAESVDMDDQMTIETAIRINRVLVNLRVLVTTVTVVQIRPKTGAMVRVTDFAVNGAKVELESDNILEAPHPKNAPREGMIGLKELMHDAFGDISSDEDENETSHEEPKTGTTAIELDDASSGFKVFKEIVLKLSRSAQMVVMDLPMPSGAFDADRSSYENSLTEFCCCLRRVLFVHTNMSDSSIREMFEA